MVAEKPKIGPTGEFPNGKIGVDDEGELRFSVGIDEEKGVILVDFGTPVKWFALEPEPMRLLAEAMKEKAILLDPAQGEVAFKECANLEELKEEMKKLPVMWCPILLESLIDISLGHGIYKPGGLTSFVKNMEKHHAEQKAKGEDAT